MRNKIEIKQILPIILSVILSGFMEAYIVFVENSNLFLKFSSQDFITLFSYKEFIVFFIIFLIVLYILFDETRRIKTFSFIYTYRLPLSVAVVAIAVIFQIHGSSIDQLNLFHINHKPLFGVSRPFRSDEYNVNTLFAFSQYMNGFAYFSEIVRGTMTDMFIIYAQPVLDIGTIFRPFLIGYLFLNQGQGLSFFWIGRLVFLFLVSFEFGMLLTNRNKTLSLAYTFLITFSPLVQWWFAINGLVELLIFGQLGILLINWYMTVDDYKKRIIIAFGLMICVGGFLLVFYPAWQIPVSYVFILFAVWIFLKNRPNFSYSKKDLLILICCLSVFGIIMAHIFTNSLETIKIILNTAYPASEAYNGGGTLNSFLYYIPTIFFPIDQANLVLNPCELSVFVDLFPIPLILSGIVLLYQKTKDKLLVGLIGVYCILIIFDLFELPDLIITLTLRSHIHRIHMFIGFVGVLILIRSLSDLKELDNKKLILAISLILSIVMVYLSTFVFNAYYLSWMPVFMVIFYFILYASCFCATSKRNQKIFLICIIALSFLTGALANPIEDGSDVIYESPFIKEVEKIVESDPNATWIVENMPIDYLLPAGAKTINSVNTYPDLDRWQKVDVDNQSNEIYNRYAHIHMELQNNNSTYFELTQPDLFIVHLNVNDLEKLNASYIATSNNLDTLSNDKVKFNEIYTKEGYKIYNVTYT